MKGLIMEKQARSYTIFTPAGEYKKIYGVAKEEVGQEVTINVKSYSMALKAALMIAMLAIAVVLAQVLPNMLGHSQAYAYVSLDINPSVEFAIDADYIVLNARPYNNDAKSILTEMEYEGKEIGSVLTDFTQSAISLRYMSIDGNEPSRVVVTFYSKHTKDEESANAELARITEAQRKYLKESCELADINAVVVDKETHNEAHRLGISAGLLEESKLKEGEGNSSRNKESILNPVKPIESSENLNKDGKAKTEHRRKNESKENTNSKKTSKDKKQAKEQAFKKNYNQFEKEKTYNNSSNNKDKPKKEADKGKGAEQKNKSKKNKITEGER